MQRRVARHHRLDAIDVVGAGLAAEPGGAAALAALLSRGYTPRPDEHVAVIICGGNTNVLPSSDVAA